MDFSTNNGWPSSWNYSEPYTQKLIARLPSSDNTSPDGIRYLEQTMPVMQSILTPLGFRQITINSDVDSKDHVYGYSAYNVRHIQTLTSDLN